MHSLKLQYYLSVARVIVISKLSNSIAVLKAYSSIEARQQNSNIKDRQQKIEINTKSLYKPTNNVMGRLIKNIFKKIEKTYKQII
jgi:hypothetical protein